MSQAANTKAARGRGMSKKRKRALRNRRIAGAVVAALAVALGAYAVSLGASLGTMLMGAGAALLLLLAVALFLRRPMPLGFYILMGLLCAALAAVGCVDHFYARVDGRFVPRYALVRALRVEDEYPEHFTGMSGLETLDMTGSTVADFAPIAQLSNLRQLDVRGNHAFTEADYAALSSALPNCHIRWSVPVGEMWFDSDQTDVDLTGVPLEISQLRALFERYPDKHFAYLVPLFDNRYAPDTQVLDLRGRAADVGAVSEALTMLTQVREIDLRGVPASVDSIAALWDAYPQIHFMFTCAVPTGQLTTEDSIVTVTGGYEDLQAYLAYVNYLPNLERMDASAIELNDEQADAMRTDSRAEKLIYSISAFGKRVSSANTELNLDKTAIASVEDVERLLERMPGLKKLSMCDCGLTQEQMAQLFDAHPDVKFVWWVQFGHYKLRTDATSFTTNLWDGNKYNYTSATFAPLRFCTDLMMLDLGHNKITSIEGLRGLKKLRVLILADNKISDISALEDLKDLEFVELFLNDITDLTPLADKQHLVDLNVFYNPIGGNYEVLKSITSLQRLWIGGCRLSADQLSDLQQALPGTKINASGRSSTGNGWRKHPHYDTLVKMYETEQFIPFSDSTLG